MSIGAGIAAAGIIGGIGSMAAGDAQADAANAAGATQMAMYNQTREDLAPYRDIGYQALNVLGPMFIPNFQPYTPPEAPAPQETSRGSGWSDRRERGGDERDWYSRTRGRAGLMYPGGSPEPEITATAPIQPTPTGGDTPDYSAFYESPGYQFRMEEGTRALDRSASARGKLRSGSHERELIRYGQGVASEEFNNYANRLASLAGIGGTATSQTGQFGANAAAGMAGAQMAAGTARASGYAGLANAATGAIGNAMYYYGAGGPGSSGNTLYERW